MSCIFGAIFLLFLIIASTEDDNDEPITPYLIVRCREEIDLDNGRFVGGELGLEYRIRGRTEWTRVNGQDPSSNKLGFGDGADWFLPKSVSGQHSDSVFVCREPKSGLWEFRAYLADFPAGTSGEEDSVEVILEVYGGGVSEQGDCTGNHWPKSTFSM